MEMTIDIGSNTLAKNLVHGKEQAKEPQDFALDMIALGLRS